MVRMVEQKLVQAAFYACTPAEGTAKQTRQARYTQFKSALRWAEQERLMGITETGETTYFWLLPQSKEADEGEGVD